MGQNACIDVETLKEELAAIAGAANVIATPQGMENYSHDETSGLCAMPAVVVRPGSTAEVSAVLKLASSRSVPVTPRGAGTGLSGGAVPARGGIVLSMERFDKILEIDADNLMAVVQPGVITGVVQKAAEEKGLFYPPDPASLDSCFIGGNVAENSGGPRAFKYGVTRKYLCGIEVVWADGRISRLGGKTIKNVAGYDLLGLVCGSEGTLGVVTEITLNLIPRPPEQADLLIPFPSIRKAVEAATAIIRARIVPATMEFMERRAVDLTAEMLEKEAPFSGAEAHLLVQLDGPDKEQVQRQYEKIGEIALEYGAEDVLVAEDKASSDRVWEFRRAIADALTHKSKTVKKEDIVVPRAKIPEMFDFLRSVEEKHGVYMVSFGHIGDGNIHVNLLKMDMPDQDWEAKAELALSEIYMQSVKMGGTITGEHGVGLMKKPHLPAALDPAALDMMKRVKKALDPQGILNPGKIFPD
ncbi:MAG: FAD-binding protein [Elusimicrobia bacterium]|nr:FAD-binding protein [Elusimicrobiota bacterium]